MPEAQAEFPKYRSHKMVHALKLKQVEETAGFVRFHPVNGNYKPITHNYHAEVVKRCKAKEMGDPGYYVVYPDGFISWSPTEAFEGGYTAI